MHQHPGVLPVPVPAGLLGPSLRDRRQRVPLQPLPERCHLPGPDRGVPVHLHARWVGSLVDPCLALGAGGGRALGAPELQL